MRHKAVDQLSPAQVAKLVALAQSDDPPTWKALAQRFAISKGWLSELLAAAKRQKESA